jgi:hypothetical protein
MNGQCKSPDTAAPLGGDFVHLRRRVHSQSIARIEFVYCVLAEVPYVTLQAAPSVPSRVVRMSRRMRQRLVCTFFRWMALHESDWLEGPDCAGVFVWDVLENQIKHRHSGYTQHHYSSTHTGGQPGAAQSPSVAPSVSRL